MIEYLSDEEMPTTNSTSAAEVIDLDCSMEEMFRGENYLHSLKVYESGPLKLKYFTLVPCSLTSDSCCSVLILNCIVIPSVQEVVHYIYFIW